MNIKINIVRNSLFIIGAILVLIGLIGFFDNPVFGIFPVNILWDLIYIVGGLLVIIFAIHNDKNDDKSIKKETDSIEKNITI